MIVNGNLPDFAGNVISKGQITLGDVRRLQRNYLPGVISKARGFPWSLRRAFSSRSAHTHFDLRCPLWVSEHVHVMSALPPKADIGTRPSNVRFVPKVDIDRTHGRIIRTG